MNIKFIIEYDGKNFYGWQKQSHRNLKQRTVQESIENSLKVLFPKELIKLTGSGRTDAGVHAYNQVANVRINDNKVKRIGLSKMLCSLNSILPDDIVIKKAVKVSDDFNARYSAKNRSYQYYFSTEIRAINREKVFRLKTKFDFKLAKEFCKTIIGEHSFKSLCKNKEDVHNFRCIVKNVCVKKSTEGKFVFEITANRFLHSMVRAIAGAMFKVSSNKLSLEDFKNKFNKEEKLLIHYAPAYALFLNKVTY